MGKLVHILHIDDYQLDRELVRDALEKEHHEFRVTEAASRQEFEARLAEGDYDIVLSDFNILGFEGLQIIDAIQAKNPRLPVVIVTGTGSEEIAVEAMKRGAADYVIKTPRHIRRLPHTIQTVLNQKYLQNEHDRAEAALQDYANRLKILYEIDQAILEARSAEVIAKAALHHLRQLIPCQRASVVMFDCEAGEATVLAVHVNGETKLKKDTHLPLSAFGITEELHQGKVRIVSDVSSLSQPTRTDQVLFTENIRAYMSVPLITQDMLIGTLNLGANTRNTFTTEHIEIAREIANQVAVAIQQARLYEQVQQYATELEQRVAERTDELSAANAELARVARAKDEFLASMSHELRTPLNAILGLSESLQEGIYGSLNEKQLKSLKTIEESGHHLLTLINDILDVSKIESGKLELEIDQVSVESVCQASLRLIRQPASKKRLKVSSTFDNAVTKIQVDPRRLKQILVNLLSNAVKFTSENGMIGLEVLGNKQEEVIHFTVWDTGVGIASENMKRLFQPFVQLDSSLSRQYTGTGLGLCLVSRLTEMHGGSVSVESRVGQGSRFTVSLPWRELGDREIGRWGDEEMRRQGESEINATTPPSILSSDHVITILLVEDNEENIQTISEYLQGKGYQVIIAWNGAEAISRAKEKRPDLILMDIQMPVMDGLEATRRIRADAELATIPIIALTSLAMPGDKEQCLEAGVDEYLTKPISLRNLIEVINIVLK